MKRTLGEVKALMDDWEVKFVRLCLRPACQERVRNITFLPVIKLVRIVRNAKAA